MKTRSLISRLMIALVTFFNLQCAVIFIVSPSIYASGFEIAGVPGQVLVRGLGILFIMWNIPYIVALIDPHRYRVSLLEAIAMQTVGFLGETLLLLGLPAGHEALRLTALRFIAFDGAGLILLIASAILTMRKNPASQPA